MFLHPPVLVELGLLFVVLTPAVVRAAQLSHPPSKSGWLADDVILGVSFTILSVKNNIQWSSRFLRYRSDLRLSFVSDDEAPQPQGQIKKTWTY